MTIRGGPPPPGGPAPPALRGLLLVAAGLLLFAPAAASQGHRTVEAPGPSPADTLPAVPPVPSDTVHGDTTSRPDTLARFVGTVRSRQTGELVSGARVLMPSQGRRTITDEEGRFRLDSLRPGRHRVRVHYLGYETNPRVVELRARHSTRAELWLARTVLAVEDLRVEVTEPRADPMAGFKRRREAGFGVFLDRGDIERRDPAHTSDLFRSLAGVRVTPNRFGTARVTIGRFGGRCAPTVYVDGTLTAGMPVDYVMPQSIIGIEVYRGASEVPPQFNKPTERGCGTILIWTRNPGHTPPGVEPDSSRGR